MILLIATTLLVSAFFSGTEIAYLSADRLRIALQKQRGSKRGNIIVNFFDHPSQFLGTMLVGNNIALVIFGNLMEKALIDPLETYLPVFLTGEFGMLLSITIISTIIVLIFGEFIPKILFRLFATSMMLTFTYVHLAVSYVLTPISFLMVKSSEWLLTTIFRLNIELDKQVFTRLDLVDFIQDNETKDIDTEMFEKAMGLNEMLVKHCMIKAKNIQSIEVNESVETLKNRFINTGFSKIIVYENSLDNVIGYVHHLQLFKNPEDIRSILFDIPIVNIDMRAINMMNELMKKNTSIGIIKHQGKTVGLIALEDILEEIFGEIEDEYD